MWQGVFLFFADYIKLLWVCRKQRYDLCLLLRAYGGNLITFGRLIQPQCLIGHATAGFENLLDIEVPWKAQCHEVEHFLEVLAPLRISCALSELKSEIYPTLEDELKIDEIVKNQKFIVIHPFARDARKSISPKIWLSLIENSEDVVFLCGNHGEEFFFPSLHEKKIVSLIGKLNVQQLFLLFQRAQKIYTLESFAGHLAALSETPSVVFCNPSIFSMQWRPLGKQVEIVMVPKGADTL